MADFDKTLDASNPKQVVLTQIGGDGNPSVTPLEVAVSGPGDANRLLIFTGIALVDVQFAEDDEILRRGEVRVRLNYPLTKSMKFISSATAAALSSIFNADDEDVTFAVDSVSTEPKPSDPNNPQSQQELVLTAQLAVQGGDTGISSMAYQANVLLLDSTPDIDHVLVKPTGLGSFGSDASVEVGHQWDIQVVLTGPNPGPAPFPYTVSTGNAENVPINVLDTIQQIPIGGQNAGKTMIDPVGNFPGTTTTITVQGRHAIKTATITIFSVR